MSGERVGQRLAEAGAADVEAMAALDEEPPGVEFS
jgi:hypothetical protein